MLRNLSDMTNWTGEHRLFVLYDDALKEFSQKKWSQERTPEDVDQKLIRSVNWALLTCYLLKLDLEVRTLSKDDIGNLFCIFLKYVWPNYSILINDDSRKINTIPTNQQVKRQLGDRIFLSDALHAIGVEVSKDTFNYYSDYAQVIASKSIPTIGRYIKAGLAILLDDLYKFLNIPINLPVESIRQPPLPAEKQTEVRDSNADDLTSTALGHFFSQDFLKAVVSIPEFLPAVRRTYEKGGADTTIVDLVPEYIKIKMENLKFNDLYCQYADQMMKRIVQYGNGNNRAILITHLRHVSSDIPDPFFSEILSGLYDQLLAKPSGSSVFLRQLMVREYFWLLQESDKVLPPDESEIPLIRWRFYCDLFRSSLHTGQEKTGFLDVLKDYLPGVFSGTWQQLVTLFEAFPDRQWSDPDLHLFAALACKVEATLKLIKPDYSFRLPNLQPKISYTSISCHSELKYIYDEFTGSCDDAIRWVRQNGMDGDRLIDAVLGPQDHLTVRQLLLKRHLASMLKNIPKESIVGFRNFFRVPRPKSFCQGLTDVLTGSSSFSSPEKLLVAEPLIAWGEADLASALNQLPVTGNFMDLRRGILLKAAQGLAGYRDWV
jgi:hypothetical protein